MLPSSHTVARFFAALLFSTPIGAFAYQTPAEAIRAGNDFLRTKNLEGAREAVVKASALAGNDRNPLAEVAILQAQIELENGKVEEAKKLLLQAITDENVNPSIRLNALNRLANFALQEKLPEQGVSLYDQWIGKPGFEGGAERNRLILAKASFQERAKMPDEAIASYSGLLAESEVPTFFRLQALRNRAKIYGRDKSDMRKAIADFQAAKEIPGITPGDVATLYVDEAILHSQLGVRDKAEKLFLQAVRLEGLNEQQRSGNAQHLMRLYRSDRNLSGMQDLLKELGGAKTAGDYPLLKEMTAVAMATNAYLQASSLAKQSMELQDISAPHYNESAKTRAEALAALRDRTGLKELAHQVGADVRADSKAKDTFNLITWALTQSDKVNASTLPKSGVDGKELANVYAELGKLFLRMRDNRIARFFDEQTANMYEEAPIVEYQVPFMANAPIGVSGWENSEILRDGTRRESRFQPYNKEAAAKLVVDVNAVRDIVVDGKEEGTGNVSFFVAGDPRGLHLFIDYREERVAEVLSGLERGGDIELYLRPGKDKAYYQMSLGIPKGQTTFYPWMSPHRYYRNLDRFVQSQVGPIKGGFGAYLFVSWEWAYDKLPSEGDQWTLGMINFSRNGGFTWGSGQVHELERFGRLQFKGIKPFLPAIRRQIVLNAFGRYKSKAPGIRRYWNDEVKGDQRFFGSVLEPRLKILDDAGAVLSTELTDAQVDTLYRDFVPDWMEVDYLVSELRSSYLQEHFFEVGVNAKP